MFKDVSTSTQITWSDQQWNYATNLKQTQGSSFIVWDSIWRSCGREEAATPQDR